jgi:hypothetical protein
MDAVIHKDMEAVLRLGSSDYPCQSNLKNTALRDMGRFGMTVVREVTVTVEGPQGSDDEIQWARIKFQYQQIGQTMWHYGEMVISTDHDGMGLRYTCGIG